MQKFYDTKLQNLQLLLKCIWGDCLIQERHIGYPREILKYNLICNSKEGVEAWNTLSSFRKIKDANRNNLVSGLSQKLCFVEKVAGISDFWRYQIYLWSVGFWSEDSVWEKSFGDVLLFSPSLFLNRMKIRGNSSVLGICVQNVFILCKLPWQFLVLMNSPRSYKTVKVSRQMQWPLFS